MQFELIALLTLLAVSVNGHRLDQGGEFRCMHPLLVQTILILYFSEKLQLCRQKAPRVLDDSRLWWRGEL